MTEDKKRALSEEESARYIELIEAADAGYTAEFEAAKECGSVDALAFWERLAAFCVIEHELKYYDEESTAKLRCMIEQRIKSHRLELDPYK